MKRILTALVAAAALAGAAVATSAPAEARWGWGLGAGFAAGAIVGGALAAPWLLRAISLSAAMRVAPGMERLRLGSRLRLTGQLREPSGENG